MRQRLRPRRSRMERLPLHIGLFLVYVLFQLVTSSFSSSSTAPPAGSTAAAAASAASKAAAELSTTPAGIVHSSTRASQEGQKEQLPGETATTFGPKEKGKEEPKEDTSTKEGLEILSSTVTPDMQSTTPFIDTHPTWRPRRENCSPPAIEQFPRPLMGPYARKHGGLVIHVLVAIYTFLGLAIVCDDYFVASLDRICEELKLSPDVAGATFMAAGSSAPELATVVIGVFFAKDDIGVSGVIGSAVFNIMFVISVCGLCSSTVSKLNWWPLCRDCFFYFISILVMLGTIANESISWGEALFMLIMYGVYCVALAFNSTLERWAKSYNIPWLPKDEEQPAEQSALVTYKSLQEERQGYTDPNTTAVDQPKTNEGYSTGDAGYNQWQDSNAPAVNQWDPNDAWSSGGQADQWNPNDAWSSDHHQQQYPSQQQMQSPPQQQQQEQQQQQPAKPPVPKQPQYYKAKEPDPNEVSPLVKPTDGGTWGLFTWGLVYPIHYMGRLTMPDCRQEKYRNWYPFTFCISMIWISFYSYIMVWMITIIGSTLGIPDTVMGLTFVAAGVSVPDALSSLAVIKEGLGDMAVSNAVGSNVFDILVCLGLPWFIQTAMIQPGSHVNVTSRGLTYSTLSLLSTVVFLVVATHFNGWKLDRRYGVVLMIWYLIFIVLASLYELNVFGQMNPPSCFSVY
ncbi:probable sodium/potassium/calcium exchanger CG1090 isoform X1 [Nasonia vitripennis]|nr:probable sodium/potassium/calcium exchanger CG1090 isoform X1 [Nasonia vitripennis]XP_008211874.1 probable sodium/potassium/calcium exchanger CG1090 isoform X1 [Nasonia vitripennis]XP_008211875.1 probable sodium/potassium/calcium exchanger CG1090 isoform X1 [Nasonia vitripennis]